MFPTTLNLLNGYQNINSRLKAWISFDPDRSAISVELLRGYRIGTFDTSRLMQVLGTYERLIQCSRIESSIILDKLRITMICLPLSNFDVSGASALEFPVIVPRGIRDIQVGLHSMLSPSPHLLSGLAVGFSRSINCGFAQSAKPRK